MKRNSYPREISINMLHELTGKDRGTITRRLRDVEPLKATKTLKKYDLKLALKYIYEPPHDDPEGDDGPINPILEKAKLDRARRLSVELDNQIKRKELIPRSELRATLANVFGAVRSKILNIPVKAIQSLPDKPTKKQLQAHLKKQVSDALKELSESSFDGSN